MQRFEYKILKIKASKGWSGGNIDEEKMAQELNSLGRQGWELVSTIRNTDGFGYSKLILTLKRILA